MGKNRENITPRSPGGKALESSQFRHQIVPNKKYVEEKNCPSCGWEWDDCDCDSFELGGYYD